MKWLVLALGVAACLTAQQTSTSVVLTPNINGGFDQGPQIDSSSSKTASTVTEKMQSINGGLVPLQRTEEHILKEDSSGRTIERIIRRFDQTGHPVPPEKTVLEEQKQPGGGLIVHSTTWRGDVNGNLVPTERAVTEIRKNGSTETTESLVERQTLNGFEPVEKQTITQVGPKENYQQTAVTYRNGASGFYEAVKTSTTHTEANGVSTDNTAEYEIGSSGSLELHSQTVARTTKNPDGTEAQEVDLYGKAVPGTVQSPGSGLQLKEREVIDRRIGAGGSVTETTSVRRPTVSDPTVLGPSKVLSEVVCRGNCK